MHAQCFEEDEARARNYVLSLCHGRIPSYALWNSGAVAAESDDQRLKWWLAYSKSDKTEVMSVAMVWVERIESLCVSRSTDVYEAIA